MTASTEGPRLDDEALLERARSGDHGSFGELVERYSGIAFRTAFLITRSAPDAEEVAQDAFVAAFDALPRFRPGAPFLPWLLRIVANRARNRRRSLGRRAALELRVADTARGDAGGISPDAAAEVAEDRRSLLRALDTLAESDLIVLVCRYLLDLDVAATAAIAGCAEGTVKSRTSRALGRLRRRMEVSG